MSEIRKKSLTNTPKNKNLNLTSPTALLFKIIAFACLNHFKSKIQSSHSEYSKYEEISNDIQIWNKKVQKNKISCVKNLHEIFDTLTSAEQI